MPFLRVLLFPILLSFSTLLFSAPLSKYDVPEPLRPWVNWVLQDADVAACPFLYNSNSAVCAWPSVLNLVLTPQQGKFEQTWQVYKELTVRLPGDKKTWPPNVLVDGSAASVLQKDGFPVVKLSVGKHQIQGDFLWRKMPKSLSVTPESGLVSLNLNGKQIAKPEVNEQGRLWLNTKQDQIGERDALEMQVFRKVIDSHPMQVVTRIDLQVSGRQRDVELNQALLQGFLPLRLDSKLPARIDKTGKMQVQLRSGQWSITVTGRSNQSLTTLAMPKVSPPWVNQEVWVFEAHNDLRLVQVQAVDSIDPRQTNLPKAWQSLPAYRMTADKPMQLKVLRRGDPQPEPDKLSLQRDLWLDFDGGGYTSRDQINGTMTQGWRLEALPELQLGRVLVDGDPQFITQLPQSTLKGVEVRRGSIALQAESRYDADRSHLPISGWNHDFSSVSTTLHLPPGWKLFSAMGMDNTPNTWLQKWTLLDLFLVLITAVAVGNLWQWKWGVLSLFTLALIWHESGAPQFIWLNLIAAIALLRVVPKGIFQKIVRAYRNVSFVVLLLIVIPFMVSEVRLGLYPQLEIPWFNADDVGGLADDAVLNVEVDKMDQGLVMQEAPVALKPVPASRGKAPYASIASSVNSRYQQKKMKSAGLKKNKLSIREVDPKANIQTGPGLPSWRWNEVNLSWSGPVEKGERLSLLLISPTLNMLLNFLRVFLVLILAWRLLSQIGKNFSNGFKNLTKSQFASANVAIAILCLPLLFMSMDKANAEVMKQDLPSPDMLTQLRERLLAPADCLPDCAQIERLSLQIGTDSLQGRMRVHAAEKTAIPLPGNAKRWLPDLVLLDGVPAESLSRNSKGELWLGLEKGSHDVFLQGALPKSAQLQLSLPLKPHYVEWFSDAWSVDGVQDNGVPSSQLQLNRVLNKQVAGQELMADQGNTLLPAFLSVERTLHLGLDWTVETVVHRLSPNGNPIVMSIPLLEGESVLTDNLTVKNNAVRVGLSANQKDMHWRSRLAIKDAFVLKASDQLGFVETWKVAVSPIWHMQTKGIPVVHHQENDGTWLPTWKPWAGESVSFSVSRPKGVDGQTMTISSSRLNVTMGKRSNDVMLNFTLRSSQGAQHSLRLPMNAQLRSFSINGKKQTVRQNGDKVTFPVSPGEQQLRLEWREPHSSAVLFKVPEVDLGLASVNSQIHLALPQDRWVLWAGGPQLGPAVLFWGVLIVILIASIILGRSKLAPVKTWQWFLLGVGLSQSEPLLMLVMVAWLLLLASREKVIDKLSRVQFNVMQIALGLLTLVALAVLFGAVANGLLGQPDMQISGNNSYGNSLNWFQDRSASVLAQPWVISVPLLVYRLLMLLWALWLAFTLLGWLRWGWERLSVGGLWREKSAKVTKKK